MTERKPRNMTWESWIDRQIREARDRGEFDDLPGTGKPIADIDRPRDDLWWVKQWIHRENLAVTPPTLGLRKEVEDARALIALQTSEAAVRRIVADVNARIRSVNSRATWGPPSTLMPLDEERIVERWRDRHSV
jgi:hypothetical protein